MSGEARMIRGGMIAGLAVTPLVCGAAFLVRGSTGALGALIAVGLLLGNFAVAGVILILAARRSSIMFPAVAMPSYVLRILGLLVAANVLRHTSVIDHPTFAVTFGMGIVALLAYECRLYAKTPWLALTFSPTEETTS
jgi:hypothetical protein